MQNTINPKRGLLVKGGAAPSKQLLVEQLTAIALRLAKENKANSAAAIGNAIKYIEEH